MSFISNDGYEKIKSELKTLLYDKNKEIVKNIADARALGDLSENAEYQSARDDQRKLLDRVKYLEELLKNSTPVDLSSVNTDVVNFGTKITIQNDRNIKKTYSLLHEFEADIDKGIINYEAPLIKIFTTPTPAKVGDSREFNGIIWTILKIETIITNNNLSQSTKEKSKLSSKEKKISTSKSLNNKDSRSGKKKKDISSTKKQLK